MITVNLDKAKQIAHKERRLKRAQEFEPLDNLIVKQIPGTDVQQVEAQRQTVRDKYADMQLKIDAATTIDELKKALGLS